MQVPGEDSPPGQHASPQSCPGMQKDEWMSAFSVTQYLAGELGVLAAVALPGRAGEAGPDRAALLDGGCCNSTCRAHDRHCIGPCWTLSLYALVPHSRPTTSTGHMRQLQQHDNGWCSSSSSMPGRSVSPGRARRWRRTHRQCAAALPYQTARPLRCGFVALRALPNSLLRLLSLPRALRERPQVNLSARWGIYSYIRHLKLGAELACIESAQRPMTSLQ